MLKSRKIRDVMIGILELPHMPYWFNIKQSITLLVEMSANSKMLPPQVLLVFDELYNLVGIVGVKEILRGLEPGDLTTDKQITEQDQSLPPLPWDTMFDLNKDDEQAHKPVSDIMLPVRYFVDADEPLSKAAYLMAHNNLDVLPVIENKKKLIGIVRIAEVFDVLSNAVLKE
ncbi:MAG: CBS domain-containing protein [Nitrospirae bacterium YQR-1]